MRFRPLDDRIVILPDPVKKEIPIEGLDIALQLTDESQQPADAGEVVAVGPGARIMGSDERTTMAVSVGDRVHFGRYSGYRVTVQGIEYVVMKEEGILGIMDGANVEAHAVPA